MDEVFKQIGMLMMSGLEEAWAFFTEARTWRRSKLWREGITGCKRALSGALGHGGGYDEPRKSGAGFKTMIDSLYPAVEAFRLALDAGEK